MPNAEENTLPASNLATAPSTRHQHGISKKVGTLLRAPVPVNLPAASNQDFETLHLALSGSSLFQLARRYVLPTHRERLIASQHAIRCALGAIRRGDPAPVWFVTAQETFYHKQIAKWRGVFSKAAAAPSQAVAILAGDSRLPLSHPVASEAASQEAEEDYDPAREGLKRFLKLPLAAATKLLQEVDQSCPARIDKESLDENSAHISRVGQNLLRRLVIGNLAARLMAGDISAVRDSIEVSGMKPVRAPMIAQQFNAASESSSTQAAPFSFEDIIAKLEHKALAAAKTDGRVHVEQQSSEPTFLEPSFDEIQPEDEGEDEDEGSEV